MNLHHINIAKQKTNAFCKANEFLLFFLYKAIINISVKKLI